MSLILLSRDISQPKLYFFYGLRHFFLVSGGFSIAVDPIFELTVPCISVFFVSVFLLIYKLACVIIVWNARLAMEIQVEQEVYAIDIILLSLYSLLAR